MKPKFQALLLGILAYGLFLLLISCSTINRDYQVNYDADSRQCTAGVRLSSGTGQRSFSATVSKIDWTLPNTDIPKFYRDK